MRDVQRPRRIDEELSLHARELSRARRGRLRAAQDDTLVPPRDAAARALNGARHRHRTLVARRMVADGVGVNDECMLIDAREVPEPQQPAWIPEIALVGGAG